MAVDKNNTFDACIESRLDNQLLVLKSQKCACFSCGRQFSAREVVDWDERKGKLSALCPLCGMATVVGDGLGVKITDKFGNELQDYAIKTLGNDFFVGEANSFCASYVEGKVNHTASTEGLYVTYGSMLAVNENYQRYLMDVIRIVSYGGEFVTAQPQAGINLLEMPAFSDNPGALTMLADLYSEHLGPQKDSTQDKKAYEAAMKGSVLGGLLARCFLFDFTLHGVGCKADENFAESLLLAALPEAMGATRGEKKYVAPELLEYFIRLGDCAKEGEDRNVRDAIRFYLLAQYFLGQISEDLVPASEREDLLKDLSELKAEFGSIDAEIMLDEQTFFDTFLDFDSTSLPINVSHIDFDSTFGSVRLALAPDSEFILIDSSSGKVRRVYHEEAVFDIQGVLQCDLPSFPFAFNSIKFIRGTPSVWEFYNGSGNDNLVGKIIIEGMDSEDDGE